MDWIFWVSLNSASWTGLQWGLSKFGYRSKILTWFLLRRACKVRGLKLPHDLARQGEVKLSTALASPLNITHVRATCTYVCPQACRVWLFSWVRLLVFCFESEQEKAEEGNEIGRDKESRVPRWSSEMVWLMRGCQHAVLCRHSDWRWLQQWSVVCNLYATHLVANLYCNQPSLKAV